MAMGDGEVERLGEGIGEWGSGIFSHFAKHSASVVFCVAVVSLRSSPAHLC